VFESNKVNNFSAAVPVSFTLTPPDLEPLPLAVVGGSVLTSSLHDALPILTWGMTNKGNGLAAPAWYDRVWFSTNGLVDAQSINRSEERRVGTLAAGGGWLYP